MRVVVLDNLRSAWNVGSVFRTAAALNYQEVALCGVCITPPSKKLSETSRGMENWIPWRYFAHTLEALDHYKNKGFDLVALESGCCGTSLIRSSYGESVAWVLGNEAKGLGSEILERMDHIVELPMLSAQASINVACAFAASAYVDYFKNKRDP